MANNTVYINRIIKKYMQALACMIFLFCMISCSKDENRFSRDYPCSFTFFTEYHQTSDLAKILNNPGLFVIVTSRQVNGITQLTVAHGYDNKPETIKLTTEKERRFDYTNMGANRSIIIGCTSFSEQRAYDAQCPYCLDTKSGVDYPLAFIDNGQKVKCSVCNRIYELTNGTCISGATTNESMRLKEYRVKVYMENVFPVIYVSNK
ncbi:hypothetical protein [Xylanibacter muris]|nr:hypothetical protein [Xylanibacter muris]